MATSRVRAQKQAQLPETVLLPDDPEPEPLPRIVNVQVHITVDGQNVHYMPGDEVPEEHRALIAEHCFEPYEPHPLDFTAHAAGEEAPAEVPRRRRR